MNYVVTNMAKKKLMLSRVGLIPFAKIVGFAFGDGGVDVNGNPIEPSEDATSLMHETFRRAYDSAELSYNGTSVTYSITFTISEITSHDMNELALYDSDGDLVCIKTFPTKSKDSGLNRKIEITYTY